MTDRGSVIRRRWPLLLSNAGISAMTALVAAIGVTALVVMLRIATGAAADQARLQIEALKYGIGFFAAGGAVAALLLSFRRQLLAERAHELAVKAQAHTETDATERRVTELYTKAVEQLGSADAAVRLGGLYALERVAQNNPDQRQTIVNVLCAYLRMPYALPAAAQPASIGPVADLPLPHRAPPASRDPHQELQVRLTAQRILASHLTPRSGITPKQAGAMTPAADQTFWPGIDLNLTGAHLVGWQMNNSHVGQVSFAGVTFTGDVEFAETTFSGPARFDRAVFTSDAIFHESVFAGDMSFHTANFSGALFGGATFAGAALFDQATFSGDAVFSEATFAGGLGFSAATCVGGTVFRGATFAGGVTFNGTTFADEAWFPEATFTGIVEFRKATFSRQVDLSSARVQPPDGRRDVWPAGWVQRAEELVRHTPTAAG
ncbi:hypothetical protein AMIS_36250 [Actinoplanes missouriensis 431]|uniref:Pentapeptide repeat-containing protein n=2 Tax=Actinoplanes missouriensis TaxID=1866 RepID=I0H758_ACTM4|nr:hypothetical protein AMIS_36250 [Actinoplanes missouriensis 431]